MARTKKTQQPVQTPRMETLPPFWEEVHEHPFAIGTAFPLGVTYLLTWILSPIFGDVGDAITIIVNVLIAIVSALFAFHCYRNNFVGVWLWGVMAVFSFIYIVVPLPGKSSFIIYGLLAGIDVGVILRMVWNLFQQQEIKHAIILLVFSLVLVGGGIGSFKAIDGTANYKGTWVSNSGNYQIEFKSNQKATVTVKLKSYSESYHTEWKAEDFPELGGKCAVYWGDSRQESVFVLAPNGVLYSDRGSGLSQTGFFLHKE